MAVNIVLLPGELGFVALVMLCGCQEVSDGTIHWDVLAAIGAACFTFNFVIAALAYAHTPDGATDVPTDD